MFLQTISILLILILLIGYKFYYSPKKEIERYKRVLTSLGYSVHLQDFAFMGSSFLKQCRKSTQDPLYTSKHSYSKIDFVIGNVFDKADLIIVNPEILKQFWSAQSVAKYKKYEILILGAKEVLGDGIIFSEGQAWKTKRRIISKIFNFDLLKENISKISQICQRWLNQFDKNYEDKNGVVKFDPLSLSVKIFNGVMMKCFFGCEQINQKIRGQPFEDFATKVLENASELSKDPFLLIFGHLAYKYGINKAIRRVKEDSSIFTKILQELTRSRTEQVLKSPKPQRYTDILQALIFQKMKNKEEFAYTNQELFYQFSTFLVAGTDTTSRYLTMMIYYIAKYPHIQQRLRRQVGQFIQTDEDIAYENLKKINYIDWIQFETTRHYGPVNGQFMRVATEDNFLKDVPITKGTLVTTQPMGNHYNHNFFKDPEVFRPERWQNQCDNLPPYAISGFGGGPRSCIGKQLAILESKIALVKLILRYKQWIAPTQELTMKVELIYYPLPFNVTFIKRQEKK